MDKDKKDIIRYIIFIIGVLTIIFMPTAIEYYGQHNCYVFHYEDRNIYYAKILPEKAFHDKIDTLAENNRTFTNANFTFQYWDCEKIEQKLNKTIPKSGLVFKWGSK